MKRIFLITSLLLAVTYSGAQSGSWKVKVNNKPVLTTSKEDTLANKKTINRTEWKKTGNLEIIFTENEKDTWMRSFLFYDRADNELLRKDSNTHIIISLKELKKLFAGKKEIIIYTTIAPVDPNLAIRMRRVHLCTLRIP